MFLLNLGCKFHMTKKTIKKKTGKKMNKSLFY